jgi:hypothetical protein
MLEAAGALETIAESNQLFSTVSMLVQLSNQSRMISFAVVDFISNLLNNDKY